MYVQDSSEKTLKDGKRIYYMCHRSYAPKLVDKSKRNSKKPGTNKINSACPSTLTITKREMGVFATFYPKHLGHACEIGRMRLHLQDRSIIAGKLAEGVPVKRILQDVRDSASTSSFNRIHLLEQKDLHNIKRDFSIGYPMKRHENDAISVKLWVNEMEKDTVENPVLYFKQQGEEDVRLNKEDFLLIIMTKFQKRELLKFGHKKVCIDGTHGLNQYDFQLFTLMVVDEFDSGVPVSFCFSNRGDTEIFEILFECIKSKVGTLKPEVFMSDDAQQFYNAWKNVMGEVSHQLLCSWHVLRNWSKNLNKITSQDKREIVFKTLKILQTELNVEYFHLGLQKFISDLEADEDTYAFKEYFVKHYADRYKMWAYCFRLHVGINTNMYLESLHKTIKHHYLEGKQCKRLDKTINALMNLLRDKMFQKIIKVEKGKKTTKVSRIQESHMKLKTITSVKFMSDENGWQVLSSNFEHTYFVENQSNTCPQDSCALRCTDCNICIHSYKCSCIDNVIYFNICKHIHAVHSSQQMLHSEHNHVQAVDTEKGISSDVSEIEIPLVASQSAINEHQEVQSKLQLLLGMSEKVKLLPEAKQKIMKHLDAVITIMNQNIHYDTKNSLNTNKNVEKQARYFSTKKKKLVTSEQIQISNAESDSIKEYLRSSEVKAPIIHSKFDHTYNKINK
uniref:Uncharacterized protein LOC114332217 n=1 Tax=Diabrotica virgifera virgifera TaxID=50390 RepID=A0A6P7FSL1_DIAVI